MDYPGRQTFRNPPLALVAAELRLSYDPRTKDEAVLDGFGALVRDRFPVLQPEQHVTFELVTGGSELPTTTTTTAPGLRALNTTRTVSGRLGGLPQGFGLVVEATDYPGFEIFLRHVLLFVDAVATSLPGVHVTRYGLRYIDEVRPSEPLVDARDWTTWLSPGLFGPLDLLPSAAPAGINGVAAFTQDPPGTGAVVRWGDFAGPTVIDRGTPLRRPDDLTGPIFVVDIDAFQDLPDAAAVDRDGAASALTRLHAIAGTIFTNSVTEDGRRLFGSTE